MEVLPTQAKDIRSNRYVNLFRVQPMSDLRYIYGLAKSSQTCSLIMYQTGKYWSAIGALLVKAVRVLASEFCIVRSGLLLPELLTTEHHILRLM